MYNLLQCDGFVHYNICILMHVLLLFHHSFVVKIGHPVSVEIVCQNYSQCNMYIAMRPLKLISVDSPVQLSKD